MKEWYNEIQYYVVVLYGKRCVFKSFTQKRIPFKQELNMKLDVMNDPWITCSMADGRKIKYGARDVLAKAHEIKEIEIAEALTYMDNFAVITFLSMLVYASYRFTTERQKINLYRVGCFDIEKIDEYIDMCRNRGIIFDVFDKERPFLQCSTEEVKKRKWKPSAVGAIDPVFPSGNNNIFYKANRRTPRNPDLTAENDEYMLPEQYAASVMRNHMFRVASGSGYTSSGVVYGEPPLAVVVEGKNLFETLLFSEPVQEEELAEEDVPMWERPEYKVNIAEEISEERFGYMSSQFFPTIYIHYGDLDEEHGRVLSVYKASLYAGAAEEEKPSHYYDIFIRNSTSYLKYVNKKDESIVTERYDASKQLWQNLASADAWILSENKKGMVAQEFIGRLQNDGLINPGTSFTCLGYGLIMTTTSVHNSEQGLISCEMPATVLSDQEKMQRLKQILDDISDARYFLQDNVVKMLTEISEKKSDAKDMSFGDAGIRSTILTEFDDLENERVIKDWLTLLANENTETEDKIKNQIVQDTLYVFDRVPVMKKNFIVKNRYKGRLTGKLNKIVKGEK